MKRTLVIIMAALFCLVAAIAMAQQTLFRNVLGYNPNTKYQGSYTNNILFYRLTQKDIWRRMPRMDRLQRVVCKDALDALNRKGVWLGSLKSDGSCNGVDYDESPEWAMGNRINFYEQKVADQNGN